MSLLVFNCNHWIAFHLIQALLEEEYMVDGILDDNEDDDLTLFFGRNSRFSLAASAFKKKYETCFIIGKAGNIKDIQAKKIFIVDPDDSIAYPAEQHVHIIKTPLLYGEWMSMTDTGFYQRGEWLPFHSERFQKEAVYIENFVACLLQMMQMDSLPASIHVFSKNEKKTEENALYIYSSGNNTEKLKQVRLHYEKQKRNENNL